MIPIHAVNSRGLKKDMSTKDDRSPPRRLMNTDRMRQRQDHARRQRQEHTTSLRKQHKEAVLQHQRRHAGTSSASADDVARLRPALYAFVQHVSSDSLAALAEIATRCARAAAAVEFYQQFVQHEEAIAANVIRNLALVWRQDRLLDAVVTVLVQLSAVPPLHTAQSYYGNASGVWADSVANQEPELFADLLNRMSQLSAASALSVSEVLCNLMEFSSAARVQALSCWPRLCQTLPATAHVVATLLQKAATTPGMMLWPALQPHLEACWHHAAVDTAWMLEALSRREDEMLRQLAPVVPAVADRLVQATTAQQNEAALTIPLVDVLINISFAYMDLSDQAGYTWDALKSLYHHAELPATLETMLQQQSVTQLPDLVVNLLLVALWEEFDGTTDSVHHHQTNVTHRLSDAWLPALVQHIAHAPFAIKCQAWSTFHALLWQITDDNFASDGNSDSILSFAKHVVLEQHLWSRADTVGPPTHDLLMSKALPVDVAMCVTRVLHLSLLLLDSSKMVKMLQTYKLDEAIDFVAGRPVDTSSRLGQELVDLAVNVLDTYFPDDDVEDADRTCGGNIGTLGPPAVQNVQFVFGAPPPPAPLHIDAAAPSVGRGRGRTLPSWMVNRQQQ